MHLKIPPAHPHILLFSEGFLGGLLDSSCISSNIVVFGGLLKRDSPCTSSHIDVFGGLVRRYSSCISSHIDVFGGLVRRDSACISSPFLSHRVTLLHNSTYHSFVLDAAGTYLGLTNIDIRPLCLGTAGGRLLGWVG